MIKTVLIVEDLPDVAEWLTERAEDIFPGVAVHQAESVTEALRHLVLPSIDLALIDLGLPDGRGESIIRHIKERKPETLCVVTTIFDDSENLFPALRAGADGYLLKDETNDEFTASLRGIMDGRPPLSSSIALQVLNYFRPGHSEKVELTNRERDVLHLIANGLSVKQAADALGLKPNTVSGYMKILYQKLQVSNRAEAAVKAVNMGLIDP